MYVKLLSSYVCFFQFFRILARGKLVTWNWAGCQYKVVLREVFLSMLCLWLIKGWLVLQSCLIYSFASRKRVSWGYSFTSSNDLFGSSWVTCKYMNTKICVSRLLDCLSSQCRLLLGRFFESLHQWQLKQWVLFSRMQIKKYILCFLLLLQVFFCNNNGQNNKKPESLTSIPRRSGPLP